VPGCSGREHQVTLFEAGQYLGGHTNTVDVHLEGKSHPVDTGFLVFNEKTYPNLIAMFQLLGVDSVETEMSFAVSLENPDIEWAGSNLATIFGQKAKSAAPSVLVHAFRHPALQSRERFLAGVAPRQQTQPA
jgi:predicted NAD/FAD-binding protein